MSTCEWLFLAILMILLFNNNGPPESNWMLFWKNMLTKNISYKESKEKAFINKGKCFTENNNHEVLSARKLLFWFAKAQHWVETKYLMTFSRLECHRSKCRSNLQTFKYDLLENLGLQIRHFQATDTFYASFHQSTWL